MAQPGRPTDFTPDLGERILGLMAGGLSLAAAAADCGIHRQRVYDWERRHPDFADTVKLARSMRQLFLERRLLSADSGPAVTSTIFALKNAAPEDWRDRQEHQHSGPDGGAIPFTTFSPGALARLTDEELNALACILAKLDRPEGVLASDAADGNVDAFAATIEESNQGAQKHE